MLAAILASGFGAVLTSCNWTEAKVLPVAGTLDAELGALNAERSPFNSQSSTFSVMSDTVAGVSVFGIDRVDTVSTQGYGIVVVKGATQTTFPNIRNVRQPQAKYDREADVLWLTSSAMEGTGVQVEWLCQMLSMPMTRPTWPTSWTPTTCSSNYASGWAIALTASN